MVSHPLYEKVDKALHSAIDNDQVMLMQIEELKMHLSHPDPDATRWLEKLEQLVLDQGQLMLNARKDLREMANVGSLLDQLKAEIRRR